MNTPSHEQQIIIDHLKNDQNVIVDACAGSGKSTTVLSAAAQMKDSQFIQLTFNRALAAEIKERIDKYGLNNIRVFTYHSLMVHYYFRTGYTDQEMRRVVNCNTPPILELPKVDVLVIDEAQDMSILYFRFIVKFCKDSGRPIQLFILGDEQQALYGFKGSDTRFLTEPDQIWKDLKNLKSGNFQKCSLKTSYRATLSMARFVNEIMMGKPKMFSYSDRLQSPVVYVRQTNVVIAELISRNICELLDLTYYPTSAGSKIHNYRRRRPGKNAKYVEQDFFILAQSVKHTNSIVSMIERTLSYNGVACYLPTSDEIEVDERVTAHKVVFSSFCRAKGRQRKIVYVVGFDQTHFRFKSDVDPSEWNTCQNDLYVACTRASEHLCVCESAGPSVYHQPLRFLQLPEEDVRNHEIVRYTGTIRGELDVIPPPKVNLIKNISVTDLLRFIRDPVIESIEDLVDRMFIQRHFEPEEDPRTKEDDSGILPMLFSLSPSSSITDTHHLDEDPRCMRELDIPSVVQVDPVLNIYEDVSAINGITIPYMFFDRTNPGYMRNDIRYFAKQFRTKHPYIHELAQNLPDTLTTISDYLKAGTVMSTISEKMTFRVQNLEFTDYDWIFPEEINTCMDRLEYIFANEPRVPCKDDHIEPPPAMLTGSRARLQRELYEEKIQDHTNMSRLRFHSDQDIIEHLFITQGENDTRYERIDRAMETILPGIKVRFSARLDYISKGHIWELKCCKDLTFNHYLQVIIYAWLWRMTDVEREEQDDVCETDNCVFHLYNIRTNAHYELRATTEELEHVVGVLLRGKYLNTPPATDKEFVETCRSFVCE